MGEPSQATPSELLLRTLEAQLDRHEAALARAPRISVAFSGGLDSTVVLRALTELGLAAPLRAVHIDHGLHPDSKRWLEYCREVTRGLGIEFESRRVRVDTQSGLGLEGAAREARYDALRDMIVASEVVVTAHHADDQLETVLLRLLRGAGVKGLGAVAEFAPCGPGALWRPLLAVSRAQIQAVAEHWSLDWIEDPSNTDLRHDRNFLRAQVLPRLTERWPAAAHAAARLSAHMRDAERNLAGLAALDLDSPQAFEPVPRATLRGLSPPRQRNALRWLIERQGLPMPNATQLEALRESLNVTRPDAATLVGWPGAEARVFRDKLYLLQPQGLPDAVPAGRVSVDQDWRGGALGCLSLEPSVAPGLPEIWARDGIEVRFRRGGERFKPLHAAHTKPLKRMLQEARILPWMRDKIPLLYREGQLVAVADLWLHDDLRKEPAGTPSWQVRWREHPPIR